MAERGMAIVGDNKRNDDLIALLLGLLASLAPHSVNFVALLHNPATCFSASTILSSLGQATSF